MSDVAIDPPYRLQISILTLFLVLAVAISSSCAWRGPEACIRTNQPGTSTETVVSCVLEVLKKHNFHVRSVHSDSCVITTRWLYFEELPVRLEYHDFTLLQDTSGRIKLRVMVTDGGAGIAVLARLQIHGTIIHDLSDINGIINTNEYWVNESISEVVCLVEEIEDILAEIARRLGYDPRVEWRELELPQHCRNRTGIH